MGQAQVQVVSQCLPIGNCSLVSLCLYSEWADKTLSGVPIVTGKVVNVGKTMVPVNGAGCAQPVVITGEPSCGNVYQTAASANTAPACVYTVNVELEDWFQDDPDTGKPWILTDADICAIDDSACIPQALISAMLENLGIQVDATLKRDGNIVGINDADLTPNGAETIVGIDAEGNAIRVPYVVAFATMANGSTSLGLQTAEVPIIVDWNVKEYDPENIITTGANWHVTFPYKAVYRVTASVRFSNTVWGHHAALDYPQIRLFTQLNSDAVRSLGQEYIDYNTGSNLLAPELERSRLIAANAGDILRFFTDNTDTSSGAIHSLVGGDWARFSVELVAFIPEA